MTHEHRHPVDPEQHDDHDESNNGGRRSTAEWVTLCTSLVIVLGILGLISYLYIRGNDALPDLVVDTKLEELRSEGNGYYLPVEVTNEGDRTAEDVRVEAELDSGNGQIETTEISVMFLAGGERVTGTFIFEADPTAGELTVRAISYRDP